MVSIANVIVGKVTVVYWCCLVAIGHCLYALCLIQFVNSMMPCRFLVKVIYDITVLPRY